MVTLLGFSSIRKKEKIQFHYLHARDISLYKHYFENPNDGNVQKWVPKALSKFQDDPTVNKSEIVVLMGHVLVYAKKKRILGEKKERERIWEEEKN